MAVPVSADYIRYTRGLKLPPTLFLQRLNSNICESPCKQKYVSYGAVHRADESAKTKRSIHSRETAAIQWLGSWVQRIKRKAQALRTHLS